MFGFAARELHFCIMDIKVPDEQFHRRKNYTLKKFAVFPFPGEMSLTKLPLAGNKLIIPGQGEFGT
jgi:hypothetical protein